MASDLVVVVSGPSGTGKSTLVKVLLDRRVFPNAFRVVTWTTREPRETEVNGKDYIFVGREKFERAVEEGRFLEWAYVHTAYYGSPRDTVLEGLRDERLPILVVDVQGGLAIRRRLPRSVLIFLVPPSMEVLKERMLAARHPENELSVRLINAEWEMRHIPYYDYVVTNDDLERAVGELETVIRAESLRSSRRREAFVHPL
ncbi:MAG: guanylate kinase [bacterium JZ-2024 1]